MKLVDQTLSLFILPFVGGVILVVTIVNLLEG